VSPTGERESRRLRLFFALWPSDRQRAALAAAAESVTVQVEGQPVPPGNYHVTLAFLGSVPGSSLAHLIAVGGQGPWPSVPVKFDRVAYWSEPRVVVGLSAEVPAAGLDVVDRLWRALEPLGIEREQRPWRPHLTLVRRVRRTPPENLALAAVESSPDGPAWRLALVESTAHSDGSRYRAIAEWPLGDCHL
jgi:2'-5' RNA ligase